MEMSPLCGKNPSGIGRYAKNLYHELKKIDSTLSAGIPLSWAHKSKRVWSNLHDWPTYYSKNKILSLKKKAIFHAVDLRMPQLSIPTILTIHDLFIFKENHDRFTTPLFREKKEKELRYALNRADAIVAVSQATKDDLVDRFHYPEKKITVTHLAVEEKFFTTPSLKNEIGVVQKYQLPPKYLLFIGAISERKNAAGIIQAYAKSKIKEELPLVMAGGFYCEKEILFALILKEKIQDRVFFTNYLDDDDLIALYDRAAALIFPTFYEGFGIPLLEAAARGVPVLAGKDGAPKEILEENAIYVSPYNLEEITDGIDRITQFSQEQIEKAYLRAKSFSWARCAQETYRVYQSSVPQSFS